jgi:hypothetical protein
MPKTRKNRGIATRGWKKQKPGYHQKTVMLKKCGQKCFLGPNKSFPICKKNTCKTSPQGLYAAYIRARQYSSKGAKYRKIARTANRKLIQMGIKR